MTGENIAEGKGGFQKADLMDYGSLYGMGCCYGEDYTASSLVRLGTATQNNVALARYGKAFSALRGTGCRGHISGQRRAVGGARLIVGSEGHISGSSKQRPACQGWPIQKSDVGINDSATAKTRPADQVGTAAAGRECPRSPIKEARVC
jgi:hypothetical protein